MDKYLSEVMDKMHMGITIIDDAFTIRLWNQWLTNKTGIYESEAYGTPIGVCAKKFQMSKYCAVLSEVLKTGNTRFLSGAIHKSFFSRAEDLEAEQIMQNLQVDRIDLDGRHFLMLQVTDITNHYQKVQKMQTFIKHLESENVEIRSVEAETRKLAMHDALTGLPNRAFFMEKLESWLDKAKKNQENLSVCFVDVDFFKRINDAYGHQAGDEVLREFAHRLTNGVRTDDFVARLSGDEFAIILPSVRNEEAIIKIIRSILRQFESPFFIGDVLVTISCSIGVANFPLHGHDVASVLEKADKALYQVKHSGRAGYKIYR